LGRPTSYSKEKEEQALEYINGGYLDDNQVIPSIVGLAVHLDIAESTLYDWAKKERGTFPVTLAKCMQKQHMVLINSGLAGDFNATIVKLALTNHGYSDKTSTELTGANGGPMQVQEIQFIPVGSDD